MDWRVEKRRNWLRHGRGRERKKPPPRKAQSGRQVRNGVACQAASRLVVLVPRMTCQG